MQNRKLDSLQVLRGFAAVAVVCHHAFRATTVKLPDDILLPTSYLVPSVAFIQLGAVGVDIFFILSGFLMVYISTPYLARERSIGHFLSQRVIRIWPLYALVTAFLCCQKISTLLRHGGEQPDLALNRLASFFFIPSFNKDGLLQPILGVGWTLNYEMFFYLCFAAVLFSGGRRLLTKLAAVLCVAFAAGLALKGTVAGAFLSNSIMFEFLFGAVLGTVLRAGKFSPRHGPAWLAAGLGLLLLSMWVPASDLLRPIVSGVPAVLIFIGVLALELHKKIAWPRGLTFLGDASYSIYLVHTLVIYPVIRHALKLLVRTPLSHFSAFGASAIAIVLAVAMGVLSFLFVERPLLRACQGLYNRVAGKADRAPAVS